MDLDQAIAKYGGKAGQLMVLKEALPDLPIPKFHVFKHDVVLNTSYGELVDLVGKEVKGMRTAVVRGSNIGDHFGLEGIIPSFRDVNLFFGNSREDEGIVKVMDHVANNIDPKIDNPEQIKSYERLYGPQDRKTNVMIMEQNYSRTLLVALRHPHNPDYLQIEITLPPEGHKARPYLVFQYNTKNHTMHMHSLDREEDAKTVFGRGFVPGTYQECAARLKEIAGIIEAIESSEKIVQGYAHYYELGFDDLALFQVRPFMEYSLPSFDFDTSNLDSKHVTDWCFGQTPPEGIALHFNHYDGDHAYKPKSGEEKGYFNLFNFADLTAFRGEQDFGFIPEEGYQKQRAFAMDERDAPILSHCMYRFIKQTEVVLMGVRPNFLDARIVSNGVKAAIYHDV